MTVYLSGICPKCGKELKAKTPTNVDLFRNNVIITCSKCNNSFVCNVESDIVEGWKLQGCYEFDRVT